MIKLHIYGQALWHDDAYIVGDREALAAIHEAFHAVVFKGEGIHASAADVFANDGEGYTVHVILLEDEQKWNRLAPPYSDETAGQRREGMIEPEELP